MSKPPVARRCSMCAVNWPDASEFTYCPECGDDTSRIREIIPIPYEEAKSRRLHADFERYYEKWDEEHDPARLLSGVTEKC